jgi:hypothetical protein
MDSNGLLLTVSSLYRLRELYICYYGGYIQLSNQCFRVAFQQGNLINLEVIKLGCFTNLDSTGLKALLKGSTKLRVVNISTAPFVTGYSDIFADCNLQHLEHLVASCWRGFQSCDANVLRQKCPKLRKIIANDIDY